MNLFLERIASWFSSWKAWVVIPPWCEGVRVRLGKNAICLSPGLHFRIPGFDQITLVNTRLRTIITSDVTQEEPNKPGWTCSRQALVGFRILDPVQAMLSYEHPGSAVIMLATSLLTKHDDELEACQELQYITRNNGIMIDFLHFTMTMRARSIKLLNTNSYSHDSSQARSPTAGTLEY